MSLFSTGYEKNPIISALRLLNDEPDYAADLFEYGKYTKQVHNLIKNLLPDKPFAICLAGGWGEGKTSLLRRVYDLLAAEEKQDSDVKVIWFDAWQFEKLDPVRALIQMILEKKLGDASKRKKMARLLQGMLYL